MDKQAADLYEEWDLTPVVMPARSTLYAPEPMGVGTRWVESLTSYLTRVASAHCLFPGDLIRTMIVPRVSGYSPFKRLQGAFRDGGEQSFLFNGVGRPAMRVLEVLETLTLRPDLPYLTLRPLAAVIPAKPKGLIRARKAWCPACYEEKREPAQVMYDPLLWALQEVSLCADHHLRLSTHCPYPDCSRSLPWVTWRAQVGYCSYCQRWLGVSSQRVKELSPPLEEAEWHWQQWVTEALGMVLAFLPTRSVLPERQRVRQVVTHAVSQISAGEISAFARSIGMSRNMIDFWRRGEKLPEIDMLLQLCFRLGFSLSAFLFQQVETLHPHLSNPARLSPVVPKKKPVLQVEDVYQALERAMTSDEQPPPTLLMMARRIGHTPLILYRIHPTACRAIVARHKTYVQQRKEARLQKFREEIWHIALQLHADGEPLTQKRIAAHLSQPGVLRDPRVRSILKEVCYELERKGEGSLS